MFTIEDFDLDVGDDFLPGPFRACEKEQASKENAQTKYMESVRNESDSQVQLNTSRCVPDSSSFVSNVVLSSTPSLHRNETPIRRGESGQSLRQRKFPGPAGLLPDTPPKDFANSSINVNQSNHEITKPDDIIYYSQSTASMFLEPPYKKLLSDLGMKEQNNPLCKFSIEWVKKKALNKKLHGQKIPFLAVVVHSFDCSTPDPILTLRDPTGDLYGTLHRQVWNEMSSKFHPGAALVLRQVGVLTTGVSRRQVYLNITFNNIVTVYSSSEIPSQVDTTALQSLTCADLCRSIETWQAQAERATSESPDPSGGLFRSIAALRRSAPPAKCSGSGNMPGLHSRSLFDSVNSRAPGNEDNCSPPGAAECDFNLLPDDFDLADLAPENEAPAKAKAATDTNPPALFQEVKPKTVSKSRNEIQFQPKYQVKFVNRQPVYINKAPTDGSNASQTFTPKTTKRLKRPQTLTQAESQIFDEVLSGIDLAEFE